MYYRPFLNVHDSINKSPTKINATGRRIVDISFFLRQIKETSDYEPLGSWCFRHMQLILEQQKSAISVLTFKCRMCHLVKKLFTVEESASGFSELEVNKSLVFGAILIISSRGLYLDLYSGDRWRCLLAGAWARRAAPSHTVVVEIHETN